MGLNSILYFCFLMNTYLLQTVHILWPGSPHHDQIRDVLIQNGKLISIAKEITKQPKEVRVLDAKGQYLCPGFFDLNANYGEPGFETKEDIQTGTAAAMAGGFTGVAVHPNTNPPLHRQAEIALIRNRARDLGVDVYPMGTISKRREGQELAELYDMQQAGALAFTDGDRNVADAGLMGRALLYSKGIDALIVSYADDRKISDGTSMNEGDVSTYLGMKGNPNLAESLMVARDLYLAEYHDARIHFTTISTAESVDLIRKAKARKLPVTCDVAAHHLVLTDEAVKGFDSQYKVHPPLRTKKDIKALLKGLKDGTIDAVVSQHTPHEIEFKRVEFQIAKDGIIAQQTVLPLLLKAGLSPEQIVNKLAVGARAVVGLPLPALEESAEASLVLFDPKKKWVFDDRNNRSKSANSPFMGEELEGLVTFTINNSQIYEAYGSTN